MKSNTRISNQPDPQKSKVLLPNRLGFTVAEIFIALALLGVIAAFTLPKIFSPHQGLERRYATALETAGLMNTILQGYLYENNGCFPGMTCGQIYSTVPLTTSDGLPYQGPVTASLENYVDTHLNYVEKDDTTLTPFYRLSNGVTVQLTGFSIQVFPTGLETFLNYNLIFDH